MRPITSVFILVTSILFISIHGLRAQVHTSYLWHLEQPIYWPDNSVWDAYSCQKVWESHYLKMNNGNWYGDGLQHPLNNLQEIFSNDDRKAVYQYRTRDAVQSLLHLPEAGAQVNYSGCLMENVKSLADAGQWGYSSGWQNNFVTARGWTTSTGHSRMDIVGFSMNHVLSPLVSDKMLRKQIQAHRFLYSELFGNTPQYSKGFWPAECSFSERIIKALVEEGFEWSIIANSHLARTLNDYPLQFGTSVCNIDPPNKADKVPANGTHWWSGQIDGRGGSFAAPYCYQAHKAKYVDPSTGIEYKITVVPMDDLLSYQNGYSTMGTGSIESFIAPYNDPAHPSIVLMAHDGDNAWGGGYDYYTHSVPDFANEAASKGYVPTTIQQFLDQHPVQETDIVHVEDGSWFNAANDWGHPQFINWLWPMYNASKEFDPNGWTEDARNWAVLVAAENRVQMAEELTGPVNIANIVHPSVSSNQAELAWHYLLPAYNSGYMYYGTSLDMEVKQTIACNEACAHADQVISSHPGIDLTSPTVFIPQRYPYNPGGIGFGPTYAYQQHQNSSDFTVWTFAYDVSGIQSATLKYRLDADGLNPLTDNINDIYAAGAGVSAWQSVPMNARNFPLGNFTNNPDIDFFVLPDYMATEYYAEITGLSDTLVDYYIEVTDFNGNIAKTPIQHVYVGQSNEGTVAGISWTPQNPGSNDIITITENNASQGAKLHWGVTVGTQSWQTPDSTYWPTGSSLFNGNGPAIESVMETPSAGMNSIQIGPFNDPDQVVNAINFVLHYNNNTWNNNNGTDFRIPVSQSVSGSLSVSPSLLNVPATSGSGTFQVSCDTSWYAVSNQSWCSATPSGSGNGPMLVSFQANQSLQTRTAVITVSSPGSPGVNVSLVQAPSSPSSFRFTLANDQQTSDRTLEFDLLLLDTDASSPFELGSIQAGIMIDPAILNGGLLTAVIVPGTSQLNQQQQPQSISYFASQHCIKIAPKAPPGIGNGTLVSADPLAPSRVCRVRITNSVPFAQAQPNLNFSFSSIPYPTKLSQYLNGINTPVITTPLNCFSECSNGILNPPPQMTVTPDSLDVSALAGTSFIVLTTNTGWTAVSSQNWCIASGTGFGSDTLWVFYQENPSTEARQAMINISANGLPPVEVFISQDGLTHRSLSLKLYLEGLYEGEGMMHPAMDQEGVHWGQQVADIITLELHDGNDYQQIVHTISNIDLLINGTAQVTLPATLDGEYFLAVIHRNSIVTVSAIPVSFSAAVHSYYFDVPSNIFGNNLRLMSDGKWAIWGGDANQDNIIDSGDMILVDNDASAFSTGYLNTDLNGDGLIDSGDMVLLDNNASLFVTAVTP